MYQSWEMKWLCGWAFKSDIRERARVRERDIRVARWSGWVVDLTRVISEIVREEDIIVVRLSGWSLKKLLENERENIYLEDYEIVVDWWNLHSIIRMSNFCFILLICSRNHIWMFGRKRIWRFAKWLSGLDFFYHQVLLWKTAGSLRGLTHCHVAKLLIVSSQSTCHQFRPPF